jgi:hypothetical protein
MGNRPVPPIRTPFHKINPFELLERYAIPGFYRSQLYRNKKNPTGAGFLIVLHFTAGTG